MAWRLALEKGTMWLRLWMKQTGSGVQMLESETGITSRLARNLDLLLPVVVSGVVVCWVVERVDGRVEGVSVEDSGRGGRGRLGSIRERSPLVAQFFLAPPLGASVAEPDLDPRLRKSDLAGQSLSSKHVGVVRPLKLCQTRPVN